MSETLLEDIMQSTTVISDQKTLGGKRKLEAVTAYLEPDLKVVLEEWADSESRSLSSLVVYLLSQAAKGRQNEPVPPHRPKTKIHRTSSKIPTVQELSLDMLSEE